MKGPPFSGLAWKHCMFGQDGSPCAQCVKQGRPGEAGLEGGSRAWRRVLPLSCKGCSRALRRYRPQGQHVWSWLAKCSLFPPAWNGKRHASASRMTPSSGSRPCGGCASNTHVKGGSDSSLHARWVVMDWRRFYDLRLCADEAWRKSGVSCMSGGQRHGTPRTSVVELVCALVDRCCDHPMRTSHRAGNR